MGDDTFGPMEDLYYHHHPLAECDPRFWECRKMLRIHALEQAGSKFLEHIKEDDLDETLHHPHYIVISGAGPRFDGPTACGEFLEFEQALDGKRGAR